MRNVFAATKKTALLLITVLLLCCCAALCACASAEKTRVVRISFVDSVFYNVDVPSAAVPYGDDFSAVLSVKDGYKFVSCDYDGYKASDADGKTVLTFENVTRPKRVTVKTEKCAIEPTVINMRCSVEYDFNGGRVNGSEGSARTVDYVLTEHWRPNTWTATELTKSGFTLYGWNTRADGSGEHIGLGSRVTVRDGEKVTLYAEWLRQIDGGLFLYKQTDSGKCAVTGYRGAGDIQPFVIPDRIDGLRVTEVASSFSINMPCGTISSRTLVLPNTVRSIRSGAFINSAFDEICFSDNIEYIDLSAFPNNIGTYRINAVRPPSFQDKNNGTIFADNMDRLIIHADRKKLIFFSGCSFAYGLDGSVMEKAFDGEYEVFNLGVNGDINGAFQMEILLNLVGDGDIIVHAPEQMSKCQLMYGIYTCDTMFVLTEGNYDLLAYADFSQNHAVISAFMDYVNLKSETSPCDYADGRYAEFDKYGDYTHPRPYDESDELARDVTYSDDTYCYEPNFLTDDAVSKLVGYYDGIESRGGKVFVSYAPVNISARSGSEIYDKGLEFADKFESMLLPYGYAPISDVKDYMYKGRYFYDSDYHLNDLGALLRTEQLIADLRSAGVGIK